MCITSAKAELSKTRILSCAISEHENILAYSNVARNLSGAPNCMILPVPGACSPADFYDTTPYRHFLEDMEEMFTPRSRGLPTLGSKGVPGAPTVQRFTLGMYEVLLVQQSWHPRLVEEQRREAELRRRRTSPVDEFIGGANVAHALTEALTQLPEDRRPAVSPALLEFYARAYPGWSLVVCAFAGAATMESQPIMVRYRPHHEVCEGRLFLPGVDAHDGAAPVLDSQVPVDHFLLAGALPAVQASATRTGFPPRFRAEEAQLVPAELRALALVGAKQTGSRRNGDWWINPTGVDRWEPDFERLRPAA